MLNLRLCAPSFLNPGYGNILKVISYSNKTKLHNLFVITNDKDFS